MRYIYSYLKNRSCPIPLSVHAIEQTRSKKKQGNSIHKYCCFFTLSAVQFSLELHLWKACLSLAIRKVAANTLSYRDSNTRLVCFTALTMLTQFRLKCQDTDTKSPTFTSVYFARDKNSVVAKPSIQLSNTHLIWSPAFISVTYSHHYVTYRYFGMPHKKNEKLHYSLTFL